MRTSWARAVAVPVLIGVVSFSAMVLTAQQAAPPAGQRGGQPAAGQPGQRGAQPAGQPGQRGAGQRGPRIREGALPVGAPHPDPLPIDLFTTKNFYKDKASWLDPKYYRCNSPSLLSEIFTDNRIGDNPPATAMWGDCNRDYPVQNIKSPYAYKTAKEHYDALMAEAAKAGGPTVHTRQSLPDWDGFYTRNNQDAPTQWLWGTVNQTSTIASLLTPEYQKRLVQGAYHEAVTNAPQWSASFCYPEGLVRYYTQFAVQQPLEVMMNPSQVQFLGGIADNFLRRVLIGRQHVQRVPQWFGETVGFWKGDTLIAWTANVQGWSVTHAMFEFSSKMETIEITSPRIENGAFVGLNVETIFYDSDAFVAPLRNTMRLNRTQPLNSANLRHTYVQCLTNVVNVNGRPQQLPPAHERYIDFYGRPWAKNWEKYFEVGWEKPQDDVPAEILDIFK